MIEAKLASSASHLIQSLTAKAHDIATAHGENTLREANRDPWRWRKANLLWPIFTAR